MSGVYIKGMEMPKDGKHYLLQINSDGTVYDAVGRRIAAQAVPVPPHGRLGDLDELYKKMERCTDYGGATGYHDDSLIHRDNVLFAIEDAPTVIPAEKK